MNHKKVVQPKIRFSEFAGDNAVAWEQRKLGEVAQYRNGKAHENCIDENGKYVVVNSKFVSTDGEVKKFSNMQNEPLLKNEIAFVLSDVPNGRAIARTFLIEKSDKYTLNQRIAGITPKDNTYPYFLYILMNRHPYFLAFDDGAKQTNLSVSDVMKFETCYPNFEEQKQIGEYFKHLDNLITLHQRKLENIQDLKKTLLSKMFPKNNSKYPEIRFHGFTEAWEQRKLKDLVQFSKGSGYSKADLREEGTPIILYGRLYTKYETIISNVDTFANPKPSSVFSRGGEVIVPASGETAEDISIASVVEKSGIILGGDLNVITPLQDLNSAFLAISISSGTPHMEMAKMAQGKSIVHLHNSDLEKIDLLYPKYNEQKKICSYFRNLDSLITLHQRELKNYKTLKQTLLSKMFV